MQYSLQRQIVTDANIDSKRAESLKVTTAVEYKHLIIESKRIRSKTLGIQILILQADKILQLVLLHVKQSSRLDSYLIGIMLCIGKNIWLDIAQKKIYLFSTGVKC